MRKKFFALCGAVVLSACFAFAFVGCGGTSAGTDELAGDDKNQTKQEFASGTGTESDPYVINEDYQWLNISNHLDAFYELDADLNMGDYELVSPIGSDTEPFTGSIDGKGHILNSATIKAAHNAGLFGIVSGATIKNFGFTNSSVLLTSDSSDGDYIGSLAAVARKGTTIENCYSEKVKLSFAASNTKLANIGGFVAKLESMSVIRYCHCDVNILQANDYDYPRFCIGGFVQLVSGSTIDACYVTGSIIFGSPISLNSTLRIGTFVDKVQQSNVTNMYTEMNISYEAGVKPYYFACVVDTETLSYCLNFSSYKGKVIDRYEKCDVVSDASDKLNIYVSSADYAYANDILDTSLWQDNKVWKKGKIHPELVSYEEYVALQV